MDCPRCGLNNPDGFAFCTRCGAPLIPVTPWPLLRIGEQPDVLIGRGGELAELQAAMRGLMAGQGGIVSIIGAAGLGKTRLATELRRWAGDPVSPDSTAALWLTATCQPPGEVPGLTVGSGWLEAYLGPGEDPAARLEQKVRRLLPDEAEFVLLYLTHLVSSPAACPPPDVPSAAEAGQRHVFRALSRLLPVLSHPAPLVLVVENMHWIDESSALLLEHVWPLARQQPVLFILLYEPGEERRSWDLRRQAANLYADIYREVFLHPLRDDEASRLLDHWLGGAAIPPLARRALLQTAGGNPLFLREALRWRWDAGPHDPWPTSLPDLLAARVTHLDPETRRVLQIAAVIGSTFPLRILARALTLDGQGEDALQHLQRLQALAMIEPAAPVDALHGYTFSHALLRHAAYEGIGAAERPHLYLVVAQAIEETCRDWLADCYVSLAHHYARTSQSDQTLRYMLLAGDQAWWRYADDEAMAYYQAGLRLASVHPELQGERASLLRRIAAVHARRGQWPECVRAYEQVLATQVDDSVGKAQAYRAIAQAHRCLGDRESEDYYFRKALAALPADAPASMRVMVLLGQSSVAWARGDHPSALSTAQQALALAQQSNDGSLIAAGWNQIGAAHLLAGDAEQAHESFLRALAVCESADVSDEVRLRTYLNAGEAQARIAGNSTTAQKLFTRAVRLAQRIGSDTWAMWSHFALAELAFEQGGWDQAEELWRRGEVLCDGRNLAEPVLLSLLFHGRLLLARGQPQAAYEHYRHAAEQAETLGDVVQGLIPARLGQALALWALGRQEPAILLLEQTLHLSRQEGTPGNVATPRFHLVRWLLARGETAEARRVYDDVSPWLAAWQQLRVQAQGLWLRGLLAAAEGQPEAAECDLLASQRAWQTGGHPYEEAQMLLDLARFYQGEGRKSEASQCRDEASALFQLLGAAGDLAQAEALELAE